MYKTPPSITLGLAATRGLLDLVPRATRSRLCRAEVQRPQRATDEPGLIAVFCTHPGENQPALFSGSRIRVGLVLARWGGGGIRSGGGGIKSAYTSFTPESIWRGECFSRVTPALEKTLTTCFQFPSWRGEYFPRVTPVHST